MAIFSSFNGGFKKDYLCVYLTVKLNVSNSCLISNFHKKLIAPIFKID